MSIPSSVTCLMLPVGSGHEAPKHHVHPETVFMNSQFSRMKKTANPQTIKLQQALKMPFMGWGGDEGVVEENS